MAKPKRSAGPWPARARAAEARAFRFDARNAALESRVEQFKAALEGERQRATDAEQQMGDAVARIAALEATIHRLQLFLEAGNFQLRAQMKILEALGAKSGQTALELAQR